MLGTPCLLLYKFKFLGFQKLLWNTLRVLLTAQAQGPKFLAELRGIFVEEASELNLEFLHIRLIFGAQWISR
jgi:hypothetical protein